MKEVGPGIGQIVANDLDAAAVEAIARNVRHNCLDPTTQIIAKQGDAVYVPLPPTHHSTNDITS
jgi:tRNA G26 N,N-dimethylase Trm1